MIMSEDKMSATLRTKFRSNQEWAVDPDFVEIYIHSEFVEYVEKALQFLAENEFVDEIQVGLGFGYELFKMEEDADEDAGEVPETSVFEPEYSIGNRYAAVMRHGLRFKFDFKHTDDKAWSDDVFTIDQVKTAIYEANNAAGQVMSGAEFNSFVQVAADSVAKLRRCDVERVLDETPVHLKLAMAERLKQERPDLADEVDDLAQEAQANKPAPAQTMKG